VKEKNIPLLLSYYFGENAASAQRGASRRLKKWSLAFERWLAERKKKFTMTAVRESQLAWKRLVRQCGKMPWEVAPEDLEEHIRWMQADGYARVTTNTAVNLISNFYEWCATHKVDEACGKDFNPARGVARLRVRFYERSVAWSREEVGGLLELMERDKSVLGKRTLAFLRLRLSSGVLLKDLLSLKWEQLEQDGEEAWVRWRASADRVKLDAGAWQAIRDYLVASGRLEGMAAGKYIFSPLRFPEREETGRAAQDWVEQRSLSVKVMQDSLKIYGSRLWIAKEKQNWAALRMTAISQRLEAGESIEGMKRFMQSRERIGSTNYRMKRIPPLEQDKGEIFEEVEVPVRHANTFKAGEGVTHGAYMKKIDPQAVRAVMDEDVYGVKEEKRCLGVLAKGLLERGDNADETTRVFAQAQQRLAMLHTMQKPAAPNTDAKKAQEWLALADETHQRLEMFPTGEQVRLWAASWEGGDMDESMQEGAAMVRLMLRNIYRRAEACQDKDEYFRLVELYGDVCMRLVKLVKLQGDELAHTWKYICHSIDEGIRLARQDLGIDREEDV
jgi:integrase